jgi:DNA-binding IscR family transcriptional regulator
MRETATRGIVPGVNYSFRPGVLMIARQNRPKCPEIASREQLPRNFMDSVLQSLARGEIIP